jgi:2-desacetyl-2-hydroxyethyl bacteriochlorophyllide A dehydrogenase
MKSTKVLVPEINKVEFTDDVFNEKITDPYDLIIKNQYSHVSAGTELACLAGLESFFQIPDTPGYTAVGEIVEKGEGIENLNVGDLVYTYGPHKQYFKINAQDRWHGVCVKVPDGLAGDVASFTHMATIAMTALRNANVELGDHVAVTGLGAIGNLAAQLAQLQGAYVYASDINDIRLDIAKKSGLETVINTAKQNFKAEIEKVTEGKGVSTLIDASGMSAVIEQSLELVSFYGEVILLGSPRAEYQANLTDTLQKVHLFPSLTLKGALEFTFPSFEEEFIKHSIERNAKIVLRLLNEKKLNVEHIYTHKLSPTEAARAYDGLRDKKDEYIGVVFDWTNL